MRSRAHAIANVDLDALTPDEQLHLLEDLWDRLSRDPGAVHLTDAQRAELDRRLDDPEREPEPAGIPWDDVLRRLRTRS